MALCKCNKCGKAMDEKNFYTYRDGTKTELCKKCLTMHVDPFDESTYVWLLQKMDVPFIPEEWNSLRTKAFEKDPQKVEGGAIFGKYLAKMKLTQWNKYRWADTEELQKKSQVAAEENVARLEEREKELKDQFDQGIISEAEYKTLASTTKQQEDYYNKAAELAGSGKAQRGDSNAYDEGSFIDPSTLPDPAADLTQEDKVYLAMKWGTLYRPQEWIELEKMYREMEESFDIQDADSRATLILLCKTNLKANQALDQGDFEGFQKLSKVSTDLRKTAKFTAAQNKAKEKEAFDSLGEIIALCEREQGFIPAFCTDVPQDIVDATLKDHNEYVYRLVTEDLGLGQQIEDAIKKFQIQKEMVDAEAAKQAAKVGEDDFALSDDDFMELYENIEQQKDEDTEAESGDE